MAISFSPTSEDVDQYRTFRALSRKLNETIVRTIPKQAYAEIGEALGIRRNGVLVFDTEDMVAVLSDCCLYDWYRDGKNQVQRYVETHPAAPGTDESYLFNACLRAQYRVLWTESVVPGAGLYCRDGFTKEELFLMDVAFSESMPRERVVLATRTLPLGEYWMGTGAALPLDSETDIVGSLKRVQKEFGDSIDEAAIVPISIVRACLDAGAAERIAYAGPQQPAKLRHEPRWPGSKRRKRK